MMFHLKTIPKVDSSVKGTFPYFIIVTYHSIHEGDSSWLLNISYGSPVEMSN